MGQKKNYMGSDTCTIQIKADSNQCLTLQRTIESVRSLPIDCSKSKAEGAVDV
jgi:hypothetical protein